MDRLNQQFSGTGGVFEPGVAINEKCNFVIPNRFLGIKNNYMDRDRASVIEGWVIKVRLDVGEYNPVWREYELDVQGTLAPTVDIEDDHVDQALFDVYMHGGGPRAYKAVAIVAPHLDWSQNYHFSSSKPVLLLERLKESEAREVAAKLQAAGANAEVRPSLHQPTYRQTTA